MSTPLTEPADIVAALAEPFDPEELRWKPGVVSGNRCLALPYVDARVIMDRLDLVFGLGGWQTNYRELPEGVVCRLRVKFNGEWCEHEDVGGFSEQPDESDRMKAAYSDALKRVAVHLGIGRYLYRMEPVWCDYDPQKKKIVKPPFSGGKPAEKPVPKQAEPAPAPSGNRRISPEQITQLSGLVDASGFDWARCMAYLARLDSLKPLGIRYTPSTNKAELPVLAFKKLAGKLRQIIADKNQGDANESPPPKKPAKAS